MNVLQGRSLPNPPSTGLTSGPDGSPAADSPCRLVHHQPSGVEEGAGAKGEVSTGLKRET